MQSWICLSACGLPIDPGVKPNLHFVVPSSQKTSGKVWQILRQLWWNTISLNADRNKNLPEVLNVEDLRSCQPETKNQLQK